MIKNKKAAFGLFVVLFMVCWNLLDFIWTAVISKGAYHFPEEATWRFRWYLQLSPDTYYSSGIINSIGR